MCRRKWFITYLHYGQYRYRNKETKEPVQEVQLYSNNNIRSFIAELGNFIGNELLLSRPCCLLFSLARNLFRLSESQGSRLWMACFNKSGRHGPGWWKKKEADGGAACGSFVYQLQLRRVDIHSMRTNKADVRETGPSTWNDKSTPEKENENRPINWWTFGLPSPTSDASLSSGLWAAKIFLSIRYVVHVSVCASRLFIKRLNREGWGTQTRFPDGKKKGQS